MDKILPKFLLVQLLEKLIRMQDIISNKNEFEYKYDQNIIKAFLNSIESIKEKIDTVKESFKSILSASLHD